MVDSKGIVGEKEDPPVTPDKTEGKDTAAEDKTVKDGGGSQTNGSASPAPAPRRAPGTKEIIPFRWKLLGESHGAILTLFKSVERSETEAQYDRANEEGYYSKLRIVDNDEKTVQPPSAKRFPQPTVAAKTKKSRSQTKPKSKAKAKAKPKAPKVKAKKGDSKSAKPKATKAAATRSAKGTKSAKASRVTKAVKTAKTSKTPKAKKTVKKAKTAKTSTKTTKKKTATRRSRKKTAKKK